MKSYRGYSTIGLYRPKDSKNIGGVMRAAYCYDVSLIVVQGARYRSEPEDVPKAFRSIPLLNVPDLKNPPMECTKVVIELIDGAMPLTEFTHPKRAMYIFGPEDGSVPEDIVGNAQHRVYVPTKTCMNLAATANVVLYDRLLKLGVRR